MRFKQVESRLEAESARELFREYAAWLGIDLCFQDFEKELRELPGVYSPPNGRLLLALDEDKLAGCIALRKLTPDNCEMKRLYVRPEFRGKGLGVKLVQAVIDDAQRIGYKKMRLDTLPGVMNQALKIYRSFDFKEIEPYYSNPVVGSIYMELDLQA